MSEILKIGLIGSAGLGRSTIASNLSKELNLVFLKSKDITRPILKKHGYIYGQGECVEKFLSKKDREFELVDERIYAESLLSGGFITDRTTIECFCYGLLSVETYTDDEIKLLEKICKENAEKYTHIFYFPYTNGWFENNEIRTTSLYFQRKIDMMIRGVIDDWNIPCKIVCNDENIYDFIKSNI